MVKKTTSIKSADNSSNASSTKPRSYNGPIRSNLIKPSYQPMERDRKASDPLTRTTPALKSVSTRKDQPRMATTKFSPSMTGKSPIAPIRTLSPSDRAASLNRLTQPKRPVQPIPSKPPVSNTRVSGNMTKPQSVRKPLVSQTKVPPNK